MREPSKAAQNICFQKTAVPDTYTDTDTHTHIGETVCVHISHTWKALCHPALTHKAYCQSTGWRAGVTVGARREEDWAQMSFSKWDWVSNIEQQQNINKMVRKDVSSCSVSHNLVSGVMCVHRSIGLNFLGYSQIIIGVMCVCRVSTLWGLLWLYLVSLDGLWHSPQPPKVWNRI